MESRVNDRSSKSYYFVPEFARKKSCGKTISIACFEIAPEYRCMGIASAFIDRVCTNAKMKGYVAVEGYAKTNSERENFDYNGPMRFLTVQKYAERNVLTTMLTMKMRWKRWDQYD